jgi:hypothetical protein
MAAEIQSFQVSVPAGTPIVSPVTTALTMPARIVRAVQITVPPGPQGSLGFALSVAGQNVIPVNAGQWIVTDDEKITWDLSGYITTGAWALTAYNTGSYAHSVYLRFLCDYLSDPAASGAGTLAPLQLVPVPADPVIPTPPAIGGA